AEGRIKVYSIDSVAGRTWIEGEGADGYRAYVQSQFHEFIRHEVVPAIRTDCQSRDIGVIAAGASIGAFNAVAVLCRYPDVFTHAVGLSGTYDLTRFLDGPATSDFYFSSPLHFLPQLDGPLLDTLRRRFVLLASGQGRAEDIGESWRMAEMLGSRGIPNRVDPWGEEWHHDWPTWRRMFPQYLAECAAASASASASSSAPPAAAG
ncbi:MAG: alpha/beta hydrolase-fold protein, partial [Candidatus Eisenbacteria bacterium]